MQKRFFWLALLLPAWLCLLLPVAALAQQPARKDCGLTLSGKVVDHDTQEPLIGATVLLTDLNEAAVTDEFGNYHFHHLCEGTYQVRCTFIGYETLQVELKLKSSAVRNFQPHQDPKQLQAVQITGARQPLQPTQASTQLSGQELQQTRGQNLGDALQRISGVSTLHTGPSISKPVIHGLHSNRVLLLNNGVRQEGQQWGVEHAPEIDPFVATQLTVIKGAAGVRYGADAIGGVVLVEPKPLPDSAGTAAELNLAGMSNNRGGVVSAMAEGNVAQLHGLRWRLQGTLKRAGNSKAPGYYLGNTGFEEHNFSATAGWERENYGVEVFYSQFNSRLGILAASHVGNPTDLAAAIQRGHPQDEAGFTYSIGRPYQQVEHELLKLKGHVQTGSAGRLSATVARQYNLRREVDRPGLSATSLNLGLATYTAELLWEHRAWNQLTGSIGVSGMSQRNRYGGSFFIPAFDNSGAGLFWIERWRHERLQLEAGLRYDQRELTAYQRKSTTAPDTTRRFRSFTGTLGAIYEIGYHLSLSAHASSAWRPPAANELYSDGVHASAASYEKGEKRLREEQAWSFGTTLNYFGNRRLNGELSVYGNYIGNYIYLNPEPPAVLTVRGAFPAYYYRQTDAFFYGTDLSATYQLSKPLLLSLKTAVVRARNRQQKDFLPLIPPDRAELNLRYDFQNQGTSRKWSHAFVAAGTQAVAKQTRLPQNSTEPAPAPSGYWLLQAEAGATVYFGKQPVEIGLSGHNLLNTRYREYLNRFRYFADEPGRNIMLRLRIPLEFGAARPTNSID